MSDLRQTSVLHDVSFYEKLQMVLFPVTPVDQILCETLDRHKAEVIGEVGRFQWVAGKAGAFQGYRQALLLFRIRDCHVERDGPNRGR
jgi:hypothetical protein